MNHFGDVCVYACVSISIHFLVQPIFWVTNMGSNYMCSFVNCFFHFWAHFLNAVNGDRIRILCHILFSQYSFVHYVFRMFPDVYYSYINCIIV